jgi:hypothetical protein
MVELLSDLDNILRSSRHRFEPMSERTDEREPVDYAADARRLLKMLDDRTGRGAIAVVPANSDCSPSEIQTAGLCESRLPRLQYQGAIEVTHASRSSVNVDGSVADRATGQMTFALHAVKENGGTPEALNANAPQIVLGGQNLREGK